MLIGIEIKSVLSIHLKIATTNNEKLEELKTIAFEKGIIARKRSC